MFGSKLKLPQHVLDKIRVACQMSGVSSVEEFAAQILEREADKIISASGRKEPSAQEVEDIANKLKGLGYLE